MVEPTIEILMDDLSVFGEPFETCLKNLENVLQRRKETHLLLNQEKCHCRVHEGIVL